MWKKASFVLAASAVLLVGCNNKNEVPPANETPMEDVRDEGHNLKNDVEDAGQRMEDDLTDHDRNLEPDVNRDLNDQGMENGTNGTNGTITNGTTVEEEEILKDDMIKKENK